MAFKDFLKRSLAKDDEFKELQKQDRMQTILEERKKGANERELERFVEEERQKNIKENLEEFRKKRQEEFMHGNNILNQENIFKGHKSVLHQDRSALDNGKGILNDKNMFMTKATNHGKGGMFFK